MNYSEIYETDEALRDFVEEKKQGLINKNNELLEKLKKSTTDTTDLTEKNNALTEKMALYENEITNNLIKRSFNSLEGVTLMDDTDGIVKDYIYKQAEGFTLKSDNGEIVLADKDGKSFQEHFEDFTKTNVAKNFIKNGAVGGGAKGGTNIPTGISENTFKTSPELLAKKLNNPEFRNQVNDYLQNN